MNRTARRHWLLGLTVALAGMYAWTGFAAHGVSRILGLAGALLIITALVTASWSRPAAIAALIAGAVPLAAATWWSVITPILAGLVLALGLRAIRRSPADATYLQPTGSST